MKHVQAHTTRNITSIGFGTSLEISSLAKIVMVTAWSNSFLFTRSWATKKAI